MPPVDFVRFDDLAHRIRDLAPPAVPDREVDVEARVRDGALLGRDDLRTQPRRQRVDAADVLHLPVPEVRDVVGEVADDLVEALELGRPAAR